MRTIDVSADTISQLRQLFVMSGKHAFVNQTGVGADDAARQAEPKSHP